MTDAKLPDTICQFFEQPGIKSKSRTIQTGNKFSYGSLGPIDPGNQLPVLKHNVEMPEFNVHYILFFSNSWFQTLFKVNKKLNQMETLLAYLEDWDPRCGAQVE